MIEFASLLNQYANFHNVFAYTLSWSRKQISKRKFNYYDVPSSHNILDDLINKILDKCFLGVFVYYRKRNLYFVSRFAPPRYPQHWNCYEQYLGVLENTAIF